MYDHACRYFGAFWAVAVRFVCILLGLCWVWVNPAWSQFRVEVTGVGVTQVPIVVSPFRGEAAVSQRPSVVVQANLERSGQFKVLDAQGAVLDEQSGLDGAQWRQRGADALLAGSLMRLADGRYDLRARLWDVVNGQDKGQFRITVAAADLRLASHRLSDWVYQTLTGIPGVFSTRIAYVTKAAGRYQLWVADADGEGAQSALSSPEPIISPSWAPDGQRLAYVSFESRKPVIYIHEITTGRRSIVANFRGSNSAPTWSPDGRFMVASLSREGGSQLFRIDLASGEARRLAISSGIDTEPAFSADGAHLFFVSDRAGGPQIYRMPALGGAVERVTFEGGYNISPAPSPDGRWLAYIARVGGQYKLQVMDLQTGKSVGITETAADEKPSFAPNSRQLVYATVLQGREALMTTTLDGRVKARLSGQAGDIREPDWGPTAR